MDVAQRRVACMGVKWHLNLHLTSLALSLEHGILSLENRKLLEERHGDVVRGGRLAENKSGDRSCGRRGSSKIAPCAR